MTGTSGTTLWNPPISDLAIECFERVGIRSAALTADQMFSFRRSINLILSTFSNKGVNLWKIDQQSIPLYQSVYTYSVPSNTISVLDMFLRTYQMGTAVNVTPNFTTTLNSTTVTIVQASSSAVVGGFIQIVVPVSIGGIVLLGFYQVTSVIDVNTYTITIPSAATFGANGGTVPLFASTASSTTITVTLSNHGLLAGSPFIVQIPTLVGGVTLSGTYTVLSVTDANVFTFTSSYPTGAIDYQYENSGLAQIAVQSISYQPVDRVLSPMSRTDYNSLPNKTQQGIPTIFWFDRLLSPTLTFWQVPDGNGPYQIFYYRMTQIDDAYPVNGQTADVPQRFFEALCAGVAFHLSMKWAADRSVALKAYYDSVLNEALEEDEEKVIFRIQPDISGYYGN